MSFDSRLLRPSRPNSRSASSAFVSVGVTRVGNRARSGELGDRAIVVRLRSLLLPQAHAEALRKRRHHSRDDAVDLLVGERAAVVAQLEAHREAALAFGDSRRAALR